MPSSVGGSTRRDFLRALGVGAASLAAPGLAAAAEARRRKLNVVFILIDDLGWADLGCYGSTFHETPNLDRLAREGLRFTDAYAACPVCTPTRVSIMTGKYPARIDITNWFYGQINKKLKGAPYIQQMPLEEVTLGEAFKAAGYTTCFVGKWHMGREGFWPEDQGFDINIGGWSAGSPAGGYFSPYRNPRLPSGPKGEYLTDRLNAEALKFLDAHGDQPFLLYLSHYTVHTPIQGKADYVAKYRAKAAKLPPPDGLAFVPEGASVAKQRQDHAVYAAMVQSMDESVGRILDKLDALGIADRTAIVFMSDNGGLSTHRGAPTSNLPLRAGKGWVYEGGIREPMMIKWPGVTKPGSVCRHPVISTDFYPTLLEMAGLPPRPDQHRDGASLVPLLKGAASLDRQAIYWHYPHYSPQGGSPAGAVRVGDLKLIELFEDSRVELYNLRDDVGETKDLAPAMPEKAAELRAMLHAWRKAVDAKMPSPNPAYKPGAPRPAAQPPKPLTKGAKDGEFAFLRAAAVDDHKLGYTLRTSGTAAPGLALKKLVKPLTGKATFTVTLQSLATDPSPRTYRNGFLVFGDGTDDAGLVHCGLYLGGRRHYAVFQGAQRVEKALPGDPLRPFELRVTVDLATQTVTMTCGKATLETKLARPLKSVTHVGYAATNTTTAFSPVELEAD